MADSVTSPWPVASAPPLRPRAAGASWWRPRLAAMLILMITLPPLIAAAMLEPDAAGTGTHTQLGLPPCRFLALTSIPCITCGYTTAYSHAAHGQIRLAFTIQPGGAALAVFTAALAIVAVYGLITAVPLAPLGRWLWRLPVALAGGGLLVGAWIYKIMLTSGVL